MTMHPGALPVPDLDWYRDVVAGAPETIIIIDPSGTIVYHNDQAEGTDPRDYIGKPIYDFFLPEFHQLVQEKIEEVFRTSQDGTYELASDYGSGRLRWYMTRLGPIIRGGQVVAVTLFIRDTSALKQAQEDLRQANAGLERRVEERTRALNDYAQRLEASEKLSAALRLAENRQLVLEILAGHSLRVLEADLVGVYEMADDQLRLAVSLRHTSPPPPVLIPEEDRFLYRLLQSRKIRSLSLSEESEPGCLFCSFVHGQQMDSLLIAPLRTGDTVVGLLYLGFSASRADTQQDAQLLNAFVESGSNTLHRILVTEQLGQNIQQREHELHVLYEIMSIASEVPDSEELLQQALAATLAAVHCPIGVIHLAETPDQKLKIAVRAGLTDAQHNWFLVSGTYRSLWGQVFAGKQVVQARRVQTQSYTETSGQGVVLLTYLGVPVRARDTVLGVLSLFSEDESLLEPGIVQLVSTIADQIGLALESTHQRQRERETLILEERQRLARELHDSVSQSLYGLVLSADVGRKLLKIKAYSKLAATLEDIGEVALQALKEMRLMLFELRPLSLEAVGLVGALDLRLNTVERRTGMETALEITGQEHLPRDLDLEVYRIASEALNNSLKHARASAVKVSLTGAPDHLTLVVADNGKGFDHARKPGGIGLSSMKERSSRIGGTLTIDSVPDSGTRVCLDVPLRRGE